MASKVKTWVANAAGKKQVWAYSPPVTATANVWELELNGKVLSYTSNGTASDAVTGMRKLWAASQSPEFKEITASVPSATSPAAAPQGTGTNEIQAAYVAGAPTGGSFQFAWGGAATPFLHDPTGTLAAADSGSAGSVNGTVKYTTTFLNVNALGQIGETAPSAEVSVTVTNHGVNLTGIPKAAANRGCIGRRIYRTAAGGASGTEKLLWTIWDNTTTTFADNIADGSLGATQPTANTTGIPYAATATQLQAVLQALQPIGVGNLVVTGSGMAAAPWLIQFANTLGAKQQPLISVGSQAFTYTATVPAAIVPQVVVSEIQQGIAAAAAAPSDGNSLLLVSNTGVPFYLTSTITGVIPPKFSVSGINSNIAPPAKEQLVITVVPPTVSVTRTQQARAGANELQQIEISPNAESGSSITLTFGGDTTGAIPVPPAAPTLALGATGVLTGSYYYLQTFLTAKGETEPSAPSAVIAPAAQQVTVTLTNGPTGVTEKRLYRTLANGAITGPYYLLHTVADNTTTSYTDNASDSSISTAAPPPTTNGCLLGELEALASVGQGNVQVSGANYPAFSGMTLQQGFPDSPPVIATATLTSKPTISLTAAVGGGTLATGTYYYQVTAVDAFGETLPGAEKSVAVKGPTGRVVLSWNSISGAAGYRVYRGTATLAENVLVGFAAAGSGTSVSFVDYGSNPAPVVYQVEFINTLGNAAQSLLTGSSTNVTILPTITISETQSGYPIQNEVQAIGWTQKFGLQAPEAGSTFKITIPILNVTTAAIPFDGAPSGVLQAIQAAVPPENFNDFAVAALAVQQGSAGQIYALTYQGSLALEELPLAIVDVSGMTPASGDTVSPYAVRAQVGSPVGRNEIVTATINNSPSGGTFGLTGTLAGGGTISATGVAYNASAATLQAAFPAGVVSVSGSAGGPYAIEAVGEAGGQKVVWAAVDGLSGGGSVAGSPPSVNTTGIAAPSSVAASNQGVNTGGGWSSAAQVYYQITATNAAGETTPNSTPVTATPTSDTDSIRLSWNAVSGATGYNIYRSASSAPGSGHLIGKCPSGSDNFWIDFGSVLSTITAGGTFVGGSFITTVASASSVNGVGGLSPGTYYYAALDASGNRTNEMTATIASLGQVVQFTNSPFSGACSIYRGTSTGVWTQLIAQNVAHTFTDVGVSGNGSTGTNPPASNTSGIAAPVQSNLSASASGGALASNTYYYEVTATNANGETTASNEKSVAVTGPTGEVTVSWGAVTNATGYKIYRGLSAGGESVMAGVVTSGSTTSFVDAGSAATSPSLLTFTELAAGLSALNDTQQFTISNAGGGTFALTLENSTTAQLPWNATGSQIQAAVGGLSSVGGAANVTVVQTLTNGQSSNVVTFVGALAGQGQGLLVASGTGIAYPPTTDPVINGVPLLAPDTLTATTAVGGSLPIGQYYYVVTAVYNQGANESGPSNEAFAQSQGSTGANRSILLAWDLNYPIPATINVYRGIAPGAENELIATLLPQQSGGILSTAKSLLDDGTLNPKDTLQGGSTYLISLTGGTDNFTLTFGANTTSSIVYNVSSSTLQGDLTGLASIGASNATVTGSGPWTVALAQSVCATGTLSGTLISQATASGPTPIIYTVSVFKAFGGTFNLRLSTGETVTLSYAATAAQMQAALQATSLGTAATVTGTTGVAWTITILPTAQLAQLTITGDGTNLVGATSTLDVYPLTYCLATGPNFFDAPANWADGAIPSVYLAPPTMNSVVPVASDSTLVGGTAGSLTSGQAYYYKVTATNTNGETNPSGEGSAQAFAGAKIYFNGTPTAGSYSLTYGGYTASIPYNDTASGIQTSLNSLTSIATNGGSCTVTGTGTLADPFIFQLAGSLLGTAPSPLTVDSSGLTGATVSIRNSDTRSLAVSWNEVYGATGYKVYRGTSAGSENVLVATISNADQTVFVDDGTYTTSAASPPNGGSNYNTAVGDDVYLVNSAISCLYNIAADVSCGYSIHGGFNGSNYSQVNSYTQDSTFTGRAGLSAWNTLGYEEYRPLALKIQGPPGGVLPVTIGNGTGAGSPFTNLDTGTSQVAMVVNKVATSTDPQGGPAILWVGVNAASEIDLFKGTMGIAIYPGQVAQVGTIRQAYQTNISSDTTLRIGAGCQTIMSLYKNGGSTLLSTSVTTLTGKGGTVTQDNGGVTSLDLEGCTYISKSVGALGSIKVTANGKFDRSQNSQPVDVTSVSLYAGATFLDPHGATVITNPISLVECGLEDVTLTLGKNITLARVQE